MDAVVDIINIYAPTSCVKGETASQSKARKLHSWWAVDVEIEKRAQDLMKKAFTSKMGSKRRAK
jgi:hypothetical protein